VSLKDEGPPDRGPPLVILQLSGTVRSAFGAAGERMARGLVALQHLVDRRLVLERPLDRLLGRLIIVIVNLLVALGLPVDEYTHQNAEIVGPALVDDARGNAVHDRPSHRGLGRTEHLHRLLGAFDSDLIEEQRVGLGRKVGSDNGQQGGEAVGVVRERLGERQTRRSGFGADDQVDMCNLVAISDQRFTDKELPSHTCLHIRFVEEGEDPTPHS